MGKEKKETKRKVKKDNKKEGFWAGVANEFKEISWPDKEFMMDNSVAAIVLIIFFALYFALIMYLQALIKGAF